MAEVAENLVTVFQFTHPCGCDRFAGVFCTGHAVSIHAPVWVRLDKLREHAKKYKFQFTHPCGCDGLTNTV